MRVMKSKWNCAGVVESEKIFSSETLTIKRIGMDTSWLIVASSPSLRFFLHWPCNIPFYNSSRSWLGSSSYWRQPSETQSGKLILCNHFYYIARLVVKDANGWRARFYFIFLSYLKLKNDELKRKYLTSHACTAVQ